jgi:hypothetical protein
MRAARSEYDAPSVRAADASDIGPQRPARYGQNDRESLNRHVRYARHALAIDENRADFDRVPWVNDGKPPNREKDEGAWWKQYWFAGNHSDIGGSYPENESRLSDLALGWMAHQAKKAGLLVNENYLRLFGRHTGPQHDECRVGIILLGFNQAHAKNGAERDAPPFRQAAAKGKERAHL